MSEKVKINWTKEMSFEANVNEHIIKMDASDEHGGNNLGPRPKPLLLAGLGGCTGMDVVAILKKMQVSLDGFDLEIEAELTDEHPRIYKQIHVKYIFKGKDLPLNKLEKAVTLSKENYCGVNAMLSKSSTLTSEIIILP